LNNYEQPFKVGEIYNRRHDIHAVFSGQSQGGISTPAIAPLIFLFSGDSGSAYGYEDKFSPDGSFWFTGEGQVGDMQFVRGNAAITHHESQRKQLLLFEYVDTGRVRFLGEVEYLCHHIEQRSDRNHSLRNAIIFHLGFLASKLPSQIEQAIREYGASSKLLSRLTIDELRRIALVGVPSGATLDQKRESVARRAEAIRRYALARAKGKCESCNVPAPFRTRSGPFLEVHHVFRLADGGPDHPENVIALCPNCHRKAHYSIDAESFNASMVQWLSVREKEVNSPNAQ
jgi:5-methylcytosine-specific restriction protein A